MRNGKITILDAGWGKQGLFTLVSDKDCLFVHYNKEPEGYAVFHLNSTDKQQAQAINQHLADAVERGQSIETAPKDGTAYNAICPICESAFGFVKPEPLDALYRRWEKAIRRECKERRVYL